MSYLVMECHQSYAVLLDECGIFHCAANLSYEVGQRVYDPVLMKDLPLAKPRRRRGWWMGLAAAACLLLFAGGFYYHQFLAPVASIYLSINPEIRMDLNRGGNVIGLCGTNEDGITLVQGYSYAGKDRLTVMDELIQRAVQMGFLADGGAVTIELDGSDSSSLQQYREELRAYSRQDGATWQVIIVIDGTPEQTPPTDEEEQQRPLPGDRNDDDDDDDDDDDSDGD